MKQLVAESIERYILNEEEKLKDGKGDKTKKKDVCPKELSIGKMVEKEHSSDSKTEEEIALDHLTENPKYYSQLVEKGMVDELPAIRKYVEHFGKSKLPEKYKKLIKEK
jgi:hypothetical protein